MTDTTNDPIAAQMAAAQAAAAQLAQGAGAPQVPALAGNAAPAAVVPFVQPGAPLSMDQMATNHFAPTKWLKVSKEGDGLKIDSSPLYDELEVIINMTEVQPSKSVKYGASPAKYIKSYDGVTTVHGDNFAAKVQEAYRQDPKCKGVYNSADIPMRMAEDLASSKKNDETVYATTEDVIGHSLSTTNFGEWANFYKRLQAQGLTKATVKVKLTCKKRTGNGNTWGVVCFDLVEVISGAQAA